jgi:hypothetical protein
VIGDVLLGFAAIIVFAGLGLWAAPVLLRGWRETYIRLALLPRRDGRYAVTLADRLQSVAARIRRVILAMEPDPAEREAILAMLRQFCGAELTALLWQARLLLETGDTERIRALHPRIEQETERWSKLTDSADRDRAARQIAALRQELESRRQTGRTWALLVQGMEHAQQDLEALERELIALGVAKHQPLTEFRARIGASIDSVRRLRAAHAELDRPS